MREELTTYPQSEWTSVSPAERMAYPYLDESVVRLCSAEQQGAINKFYKSRGGMCWWKVGEGKTRIGIFTFAMLQNAYRWALPSVCLVLCRRKAFYDWRSEIELCLPGSSVYEDEVPAHPPGNMPVFLLVSSGEIVKRFASLQNNPAIRFVLLDESWMFANNKSARSKAIYNYTKSRKALCLSGTIMKARDTAEIYCQSMAAQKHRILAPSVSGFRTKYQIIQADRGFPQFSPRRGSYKEIMDALVDCASVHFPTNAARRIHEQFHTVPSTKQQQRLFKELREFYSLDEFGLEFDNALQIGNRAQQISNGWTTDSDGRIVDVPTNKVEKLSDELSDIVTSGSKAVVWCAFRHDVDMLVDRLKFATVQMRGGEEFDLDRWQHADTHVCIATEASGSSVNHFAQTAYAIYFSSNYKWLDMQQSRGRTDRKSSRHSECFYKYLHVVGSLDMHVYRTALDSGDRERALIFQAGIKDWLKK